MKVNSHKKTNMDTEREGAVWNRECEGVVIKRHSEKG
jgi:hypothetical protein